MTVKYGVRIKIDVKKIMKAWLFNGAKGTYLDATVFLTPNEEGQYGDHGMITQDVPQAVSQQDPTVTQGPILGNCKVFWTEGANASAPVPQAAPQPVPQQQYQQAPVPQQAYQAPTPQAPLPADPEIDDIPF